MESNKSSPEPSGLSKAIYWDPNSLFFYGGSDGDTLEICCGHDYEYCTLRTREDFVLTVAGIQKLEVKTSMENNYQICNIRQRIHRWHSYTFAHPSRCWKVYTVAHGAFSTPGPGGSRRILPPFQGCKDWIIICARLLSTYPDSSTCDNTKCDNTEISDLISPNGRFVPVLRPSSNTSAP